MGIVNKGSAFSLWGHHLAFICIHYLVSLGTSILYLTDISSWLCQNLVRNIIRFSICKFVKICWKHISTWHFLERDGSLNCWSILALFFWMVLLILTFSHTILSGQLCAVRGITLASVLLLGRNGKRWKEAAAGHSLSNSLTHASHQESAKLPLHCFCSSPYTTSHHMAKALDGKAGVLSPSQERKRFCWESVTWSLLLTASLSHCWVQC